MNEKQLEQNTQDYPEVTYNRDKDELYVDIYLKQSNTCIESKDFDREVHI